MSGEEADQGADTIGADGSAYAELRLKRGYQNPREAPVQSMQAPAAPPPPKSNAMSIDDMLAFTQKSSATPSAPPPTPPEYEEAPTVAIPVLEVEQPPPPEPEATQAIPVFGPTEDITVEGISPGFAPPTASAKPSYTPPQPLRKFHPMLPKAGAGVILLAFLLAPPIFRSWMGAGPMEDYSVIVISKPRAELFRGEKRIGRTPLAVTLDERATDYTLRVVGYKKKSVVFADNLSTTKVNRVKTTLAGEPVTLDWTGFPSGAKLWWDGAEVTPKELTTAPAGDHKIKIKPKNGASSSWTLNVPWGGSKTFPAGKAIANGLARRPQVKLSLRGTTEVAATIKGNSGYSKSVALNSSGSTTVSLPGAGTYRISAPGTKTLAPFQRSLTLKEGEKTQLAVSMAPPRAVSSGGPRPSGGGGYTPPPRRYSPPPRRYHGGGGGSGGRIAPPSF